MLVIGASTGYGLASRIVSAFGAGANTIGVYFDRAAEGARTASAGWYNSAAFEKAAAGSRPQIVQHRRRRFFRRNQSPDDRSDPQELGTIDLVVYSVASPRRTHPKTGETFSSVIEADRRHLHEQNGQLPQRRSNRSDNRAGDRGRNSPDDCRYGRRRLANVDRRSSRKPAYWQTAQRRSPIPTSARKLRMRSTVKVRSARRKNDLEATATA